MVAVDRSGVVRVERSSVLVDGRERTFTVVSPRDVPPGAPIVLLFHGSNQTAEVVRAFAGGTLDRFAEHGGAVVTYLDGYRRNWNDARVASDFPARRDGIDDVAFTGAVVDHLAERFAADPSRVHAVGFSAGGAMVIRLVHEIPSKLAGAGLIAATQPEPGNFMAFGGPAEPVPVVLFHGTKDPLVPYDGGMASLWGFRPRGLGLSARGTAEYFAARNGITAAPESHDLGRGADDTRTAVERTDYRQDGKSPVTLYTVHGGGHVIPNPRKAIRVMGRSTRNLVAADALGGFFGIRTG
ncbi:PHB depolymerase family esterase [Umezawaea sp. Da 62-37]|uniref:alpha/beta hydrolase family esterase n=1 Tax=Umezawaea sp. Da 62-37 TaxID=3075927 RepID=UPI0028F74667|nr:PHB depolymerase family esterase [Umezawaea sp. Da 62-37]WNV86349.1 PHB depolymerase family esterase [Umezawaea sp. Da 62-37]